IMFMLLSWVDLTILVKFAADLFILVKLLKSVFILIKLTEVNVILVKLSGADFILVKLPAVGTANETSDTVTLVVKLAKGANILEEFIVPSTNLPSITPEGLDSFNNETST